MGELIRNQNSFEQDTIIYLATFSSKCIQMNNIVKINKLLLAGENLDLHIRLVEHSKMQQFIEAADSRYFYWNKLFKDCFRHDVAYKGFKYLPRETASNKVLRDEVFKIASNFKYDEY